MKRVIIIGGGFGGFYLANKLEKYKKIEIILINPADSFIYIPLLHEVSVGEIPADLVKISYKKVFKRTKFLQGKVEKINFKEKLVFLNNDKHLTYDYLVISSGSVPKTLIEGSENLPTLRNFADAIKIKKILKNSLKKKQLTISVIGEGATGTELIGEIATLCKSFNKKFVLHHFLYFEKYFENYSGFDNLIKYKMKKLGVHVHPGEPVLRIVNNKIITKKREYYSDIIFSCTGVKSAIIDSDFTFDKGYPVSKYCEIKGLHHVYAIGDVAIFPYNGGFAPQLAQVAEIQGKYVAEDIIRIEKKRKRKPLKLNIIAILISIGKFYGIANLFNKFSLGGLLFWFLKRTFYILSIYSFTREFSILKTYLKSFILAKEI